MSALSQHEARVAHAKSRGIEAGGFFQDGDEVYILARVTRYTYAAVNLVSGNRWADPTRSLRKAVDKLKPVTSKLVVIRSVLK